MVWIDFDAAWVDRPLEWIDREDLQWDAAAPVAALALPLALGQGVARVSSDAATLALSIPVALPAAQVRTDAAPRAVVLVLPLELPDAGVSIAADVAVSSLLTPLELAAAVGAVSTMALAHPLESALVLPRVQAFTGIGERVGLVSAIGPKQRLASSLERTGGSGAAVRIASPFVVSHRLDSPCRTQILLHSDQLQARR